MKMEIILEAINHIDNTSSDDCNYDICLSDCYDCMCDSYYGNRSEKDD